MYNEKLTIKKRLRNKRNMIKQHIIRKHEGGKIMKERNHLKKRKYKVKRWLCEQEKNAKYKYRKNKDAKINWKMR